ncbi:MAG: carbamoyl-phosphate synthase (glutamine-hydrolyzing) large subunit [Spirochaetota bacterium]|nr:carbamoyl-phosphate synthase (glutamine-hydrolyzing) large subunit [Spirochaetota bacterium]
MKKFNKILVIGSGPIIIGQAAEFDYSGTQACQVLKEEGIEVILLNPNPATIMTDTSSADKVYLEPLTIQTVEKIFIEEQPCGILCNLGGQTALNLAIELSEHGILEKYNIEMLGSSIDTIKKGEDREIFRNLMNEINEPIVKSEIVHTIEDGLNTAGHIGYPVIVRPAFTLGGTGGGIADTPEELKEILTKGLILSPVHQALIEKSIKGWKEIEFEIMRDHKGNSISVCHMENLDPVGIHTGDSIVVVPCQTLSDKEIQMLRSSAIHITSEVGVIGACNVQFALHPESFDYIVIEINPRVSRSSALASKASGYPIARIATKISIGYGLDEIINEVTGKTPACFEPSLDYVVVKIPKWPFDKFPKAIRTLGTKMMATGEVMAIGRNFEHAFLKAIRSLEINRYGLMYPESENRTIDELKQRVIKAGDDRIFDVAELLRKGFMWRRLCELTGIDYYFMEKIDWIVRQEELLKTYILSDLTTDHLRTIKSKGFSDKAISQLMNVAEEDIFAKRKELDIFPVYKPVDTCAAEFEALTPYYYSCYETEDEVPVSNRQKMLVIGSGPIRIGQGIEFDYSVVHAVRTLRSMGYESIVINNNPETVSTDFVIADKLYFEPLTEEDVYHIILKEKPEYVFVQFGGQTAIKLAHFLYEKNIPTAGVGFEQIDLAEDRERFDSLMEELDIPRPKGTNIRSMEEGIKATHELGFPVLVRPSYVLGGAGMEICYSIEELKNYLATALERTDHPILIDKYLKGIELETDAICDGEDIFIPGIMEHWERSGVHSGDSINIYPTQRITPETEQLVEDYCRKIALAMNIKGLINVQFVMHDNKPYVIEVNPRASRTIPFIAKVTGIPIIDIATKVMLGKKLKDLGYTNTHPKIKDIAVKVPVFSTEKLSNVEVGLSPEMKSTGESAAIASTFEEALYKGLLSARKNYLHLEDTHIYLSLCEQDLVRQEITDILRSFPANCLNLSAEESTALYLQEQGLQVQALKSTEKIEASMKNGTFNIFVNISTTSRDIERNEFNLRRTALEFGLEVMTSPDSLKAFSIIKNANIQDFTIKELFTTIGYK